VTVGGDVFLSNDSMDGMVEIEAADRIDDNFEGNGFALEEDGEEEEEKEESNDDVSQLITVLISHNWNVLLMLLLTLVVWDCKSLQRT
jgi:uncharacterized membrane protein